MSLRFKVKPRMSVNDKGMTNIKDQQCISVFA